MSGYIVVRLVFVGTFVIDDVQVRRAMTAELEAFTAAVFPLKV